MRREWQRDSLIKLTVSALGRDSNSMSAEYKSESANSTHLLLHAFSHRSPDDTAFCFTRLATVLLLTQPSALPRLYAAYASYERLTPAPLKVICF